MNQNEGGAKKKVETASSIFDDFYAFGAPEPEKKNDEDKNQNKCKLHLTHL